MLINGLIFGLISTLHCAGMCGPLALYVPGQVRGNKLVFATLYQIGRIGVYVAIGSVVFAIGMSFSMFRAQQLLSVIIGGLMVLFAIWSIFKLPYPAKFRIPYEIVLNRINGLLRSGKKGSALIMGMVNGFLPCGAIYIAALYCTSFTEYSDAVIYMVLFGIGTMPVFVAAWFLMSSKFSFKVNRLRFLYKLLPLIVGALMVLRGANLGIPYLSPELSHDHQNTEVKNCCKH